MGFFDFLTGGTKQGDTKTSSSNVLLSPQQQSAMDALSKFVQTGGIGNYQAGADYSGSLGDFNMSSAENAGQSKLMDLINGALPQSFTNGQNEYQSVLDGNYDPNDPTGVYQGFKKETLANQSDAQDALNRQLSVTGDTYSTNKARSTAQLNTNTTNALNSKLAELYQNYSNQRLGAAGGLINTGIQQEGLNQGRINLASTIGSLPRLLSDAKAKAQYSDFLRQQNEKSGVLNAANTLFNRDLNKTSTSTTTSPMEGVLPGLLKTGISAGIGAFTGGAATPLLSLLQGAGSQAGGAAAGGLTSLMGMFGL